MLDRKDEIKKLDALRSLMMLEAKFQNVINEVEEAGGDSYQLEKTLGWLSIDIIIIKKQLNPNGWNDASVEQRLYTDESILESE